MSSEDIDSMESSINNLKHGLLDAINNTKSHKNALSIFLDNENWELDLFDFMLQILKQTNQVYKNELLPFLFPLDTNQT